MRMTFVNKLLLILLVYTIFYSQEVTAQDNYKVGKNKVMVSEANVSRQMRKLIVEYHLDIGDEISYCFVYLMLSFDGGNNFTETVSFDKLEGDVGLINSSGEKKIIFNIEDDKERLSGKDLVFKVVVGDKIRKSENPYDKKIEGKSFLSKGYRGIFEMDYGLDIYEDTLVHFMSITNGYQFNPHFFLGGSLYTSFIGEEAPAIGVALDSRVNFTKSRFSPFMSVRIGGICNFDDGEDYSLDIGGSVGVRCALKNKVALTFSVISSTAYWWGGNIRFGVGLEF